MDIQSNHTTDGVGSVDSGVGTGAGWGLGAVVKVGTTSGNFLAGYRMDSPVTLFLQCQK